MTTVGFIEGPLHHFYYGYLDRFLPGMDGKTVFLKIILDQILASPLFISTFFYGMGLLEGKSLRECTKEVKRDIVTVYTVN